MRAEPRRDALQVRREAEEQVDRELAAKRRGAEAEGSTLNGAPATAPAKDAATIPANDLARPVKPAATTTPPRIVSTDFTHIPRELRTLARWVCWRLIERDGKWTKLPVMPSGTSADSTNPATWRTFDEVVAAYQRGGFDGIGFVFAGNFWGADFDHVTDADGRFLDSTIEDEVRALAVGAYCERSVSGTGVHVIGLYRGEPLRGKNPADEIREAYVTARYFTVTGRPVPGIPSATTLEDTTAQFLAWRAKHFTPDDKTTTTAASQTTMAGACSLDDLIPAERDAIVTGRTHDPRFDALWRGEPTGQLKANGSPDGSAADYDFLCCLVRVTDCRDMDRLELMARCSALYRDKWDDHRTYLRGTIAKALRDNPTAQDEFDRVESAPSTTTTDATPDKQSAVRPFDPNASRIGDCFTVAPPQPKFIVEDFYPVACGQENSIGGRGKTTRHMWESTHIILGRPLYGRRILKPGPVLVVTKEDGTDIFKHRLHYVAAAMGLSDAERRLLAQNFHVLDLTGEVGGRLVEVDRDGNLRATNLVERICRGYQHEGLAQVIFDPWNGFSPGERFVNDAEAALMVSGARIAQELGCNARFTAHVSKAVGRGGIIDSHSGRGGSAMGDNARFCFSYVQHDLKEEKTYKAIPTGAEVAAARGDLYRLHMTKQSYAKCLTEPIWIERQGFAFTVHDSAPTTPETLLRVDGERVLAFLRDELTRGIRYSPSALADQYRQFPLSRGRARAVIDWLQSSRQIIERPLPDSERNRKRTHYLDVVELSATTPEELFS